jgi:hypothetical protein
VTEGRSWTAPSLAGGRLYLRDFDEIVSLDVSGAARAAAGEPEAPGGPVAARGGAVEPAPAPATVPAEMSVARILARYLEARGGAERWRELDALEIRGDLTVLSKRNPFRELRRKDDLFRLDYSAADAPAIKARDATGPWMLNAWLQPEVGRVTEGPYVAQLERESLFPLLLLDHEKKGIGVELVGRGRIDGVGTIDLLVTLPGGAEETWHLDAVTFREVAIDSRIYDFSQAAEPMDQRTFFDDFREVDGLVLPFRVDWEFNARLESMAVDQVLVDPEIDPAEFSPPSSPGR